MVGVQFWVSDLNACKLSPMDSISAVRAIEVHMMDSVGARYVKTCSTDLLVIIRDAAPICVSDLPPVHYFEGQMRV